MVAAQDDQLQQEWMQKAVFAVANELVENSKKAADCGPLYHALHALVLYRQRAGIDPTEPAMAQRSPEKTEADKPSDEASEGPSDAKPEITKADLPKPARIEAKVAKRIDDAPLLKEVPPLAKRESPETVRPLSNTEVDSPKDEPTTKEPASDTPSKFDDEAAKPIVPEKEKTENATETESAAEPSDEPAATEDGDAETSKVEESPKVTYRQPEDNAYKGSDGGPGSENASEIPLPPTED
jgi:hypothetical protein